MPTGEATDRADDQSYRSEEGGNLSQPVWGF